MISNPPYIRSKETIDKQVYKYKGTVEDITALNAIVSPEEGDTYNVTAENGVNFVWTGTEWDAVGQVVSVSNSVITGDANPVSGDAVYSFVQGALALYDDILMGDLDKDGKVTASDARVALRISAQLVNGTKYQKTAADMNSDGKVTAVDARKILRIAAQLET